MTGLTAQFSNLLAAYGLDFMYALWMECLSCASSRQTNSDSSEGQGETERRPKPILRRGLSRKGSMSEGIGIVTRLAEWTAGEVALLIEKHGDEEEIVAIAKMVR